MPTIDTYLTNTNAPNQSLSKPIYGGLMGGDYTKVQEAIAVPGAQAAANAYNTGTQNLNNVMGGRGLYGSSIMQQQQTQGLDREYMNALSSNAANAAAKRYELESSNINANNGLLSADYRNAADNANKIYGYDTQASTAKYASDNSAASAARMVDAQVKAAARAGNIDLVKQLLAGAGAIYSQNKGYWNGLLSNAASGISNLWNSADMDNYITSPDWGMGDGNIDFGDYWNSN